MGRAEGQGLDLPGHLFSARGFLDTRAFPKDRGQLAPSGQDGESP